MYIISENVGYNPGATSSKSGLLEVRLVLLSDRKDIIITRNRKGKRKKQTKLNQGAGV